MVPITTWRQSGNKPLFEPMVVSLLTHMCVTPPYWVILYWGLNRIADIFQTTFLIHCLQWNILVKNISTWLTIYQHRFRLTAPSYYTDTCYQSSMMPYGLVGPQCVNSRSITRSLEISSTILNDVIESKTLFDELASELCISICLCEIWSSNMTNYSTLHIIDMYLSVFILKKNVLWVWFGVWWVKDSEGGRVRDICRKMVRFVSHDDVIKWKHFPRYWRFVRGIHRLPVNSPHKGQWRGVLVFSLICALNKLLITQSWGWWFETLSCSWWRHCNAEGVKDQHSTANIFRPLKFMRQLPSQYSIVFTIYCIVRTDYRWILS